MEVNFAVRSSVEAHSANLPYDFGSVMHYRAETFSRDGTSPTLVPLKDGVFIGQRERFSQLDLAKLNRLYDCGPEYYRGDDVSTESTTSEPSSTTISLSTTQTTSTSPKPTTSNKIKESINLIVTKGKENVKSNEVTIKKLFRRRRQNYYPYRDPGGDMRPPPPYWPMEHRPSPNCPCHREHRDEEPDYRRKCDEQRPNSRRRGNDRGRQQDSERKPRSRSGHLEQEEPSEEGNFELSNPANTTSSSEVYDDYELGQNNATQYAAVSSVNQTKAIRIKNL
jgi:hypothetical protein